MKFINRIFAAVALCLVPYALMADGPLVGTAGSNLTAFNGATGAMNNNAWNQMMNSRPAPAADFGNCNAVILRCAQPKCATGGCINMEIAYPIVSGCVASTSNCKSHGDALTNAIAAQIVANTVAKANAANAAANASAANAAAEQSAQQLQQMQMQMQQMQSQMSQQNAESAAALQRAMDEQKQLMEQQAADAAAARAEAAIAAVKSEPEVVAAAAAQSGISADILAREQASGQILTQLENADVALKSLRKTMQNAFDYAGCDASGNNCTGPKRARAFKQKAGEFFEPYETVLDEVYDALIMAQSLGVDITDIYMMLNGTCNVWGKYLCDTKSNQDMHYTQATCLNGRSASNQQPCKVGQVKPMNDGGCQLIQMLNNQEEVQQNWLYPDTGDEGRVRVGCASEAIDNSMLFRGRKKQASIDIETLQRIIEQDAPSVFKGAPTDLQGTRGDVPAPVNFCAVGDTSELQKAVGLKRLPKQVCVTDAFLKNREVGVTSAVSKPGAWEEKMSKDLTEKFKQTQMKELQDNLFNDSKKRLEGSQKTYYKSMCESLREFAGKWDDAKNTCICGSGAKQKECKEFFNQ